MIRRSFVLALAVVLSGCAELSLRGGRAEHGATSAFEMQGRVYVRFGQRAFTGALRWLHALSSDEIWFSGPLGQTGAHLLRDAYGATLTTADQQVYRSSSLEGLTEKGLGFAFPVAELSHYVLGEAPPQAGPMVERDAAGRVVRLDHDGWTVQWVQADAAAEEGRPRRLEMRKGDVEIRLVIDTLDRRP